MAIDQRVIVRRDRQGNVVRVITIHTPSAVKPATAPAVGAPAAGQRKPLVEEVHTSDLPGLLKELEQRSQKK